MLIRVREPSITILRFSDIFPGSKSNNLVIKACVGITQAFSLTIPFLDGILSVREKTPTVRLCHPVVKQNQDNHLDHYLKLLI